MARSHGLAVAGHTRAVRSVETACTLFRRRQIEGTGSWARVLKKLQVEADAAGHLLWQMSVDSTIFRVHQHAAGARRRRAADPGRVTPAAWRPSRTTTRLAAHAAP
ncbi:hypothetical protein GCM10023237_69340 [Streptomyces coeruleoprunus]